MEKAIDLGYEGLEPGTKGVWIYGNPTLLQELVRNLVDNAMKYSPSSKEKPAIVTARVLADPISKRPMLQVEDSGPGIAAAERALIFQPFYRVLGSDTDGSGLGLSIVQEIAGKHGATVRVEDGKPGQGTPGTCFTVCFLEV
jgi:two-component system sensor histidine kinase TctE